MNDDLADYARLTNDAGWTVVADRTQLALTGADRQKFLHNYCTADIRKLVVGRGCEAFITSLQGKTLGHGFVWAGAESLVWDSEPGWSEKLSRHLDRYLLRDDVQLVDCGAAGSTQIWLGGPRMAEVLRKCHVEFPAEELTQVAWYQGAEQIELRRLGVLSIPWWVLVFPTPGQISAWIDRLQAQGVAPVDRPAWEMHRLEAGFPRYGIDVNDQNFPQEVHRDTQAISFTKGCYLGQETVARIDALGHVNRYLVGLKFPPGAETSPFEELSVEGRSVGHVTSGAYSPRLATPLALGYIRREHVAPGTELTTRAGLPVQVISLPLVN